LILSTTNFLLKKIILIALLCWSAISFSCSSVKKSNNPLLSTETSTDLLKKESFKLSGDKASGFLFLDKSSEIGLDSISAVALYAVDINKDKFTDIVYLEEFQTSPKVLIFNSVTKKFQSGGNLFSKVVRASFLNFADINNDGELDVLVGNFNQKSEMTQTPLTIYYGKWGTERIEYSSDNIEVLPLKYVGHASLFDFNLDGKLDIFVGQWFSFESGLNNPQLLPNKLFIQNDDHRFEDKSFLLSSEQNYKESSKQFVNAAPTIGTTVCDVDKNGYPDILTNSSNGYPNKLWLNLENSDKEALVDRIFFDFGKQTGYAMDDEGVNDPKGGGNSFSTWCLDYNNDKIIDLIIGNNFKDTDPETKDRSAILTGSSYQFPFKYIRSEIFQTIQGRSWSEADRRMVASDFNLDGRQDIIIDNSGFPPDSRLMFFEQNQDKSFDDKAAFYGINILNPSGTILIDFNHDGVMDFISAQSSIRLGNLKTKVFAFENQFKRNKEKTLKLNLQGKKSNTQAISGSARVKTESTEYFQNIVYNYGAFASQNESGLYFSTGEEIPLELIIHWPYRESPSNQKSYVKIVKYKLKSYFKKNLHVELNICEDGRILPKTKNCY